MNKNSLLKITVSAVITIIGIGVISAYALGRRSLQSYPEGGSTRLAQGMFTEDGRSIPITPDPEERLPARTVTPATPRTTAGPLGVAGPSTEFDIQDADGQIQPFPEAPVCEKHDLESWHGLWNPDDGCHYDHTHNADPSVMDGIFGPYDGLTGQQLSYAWETADENLLKHEGYKWATITNPACDLVQSEHGCIKNFRVEFHVVGTTGANFRFHSFWLEAELEDGGIIRTGGHNDFGYLCVPYKGEHVPLPGLDPAKINCNVPPYRGHAITERAASRGGAIYTWNSQAGFGWGEIVGSFDFQSRDDFGGIDRTHPQKLELICPNFECSANHSTMLVYELVLSIPQGDFSGFTDVKGNIAPACTKAGPDCVPLLIENARPGTYSFRVPLRPRTPHEEFDIYFGENPSGWIEYPN